MNILLYMHEHSLDPCAVHHPHHAPFDSPRRRWRVAGTGTNVAKLSAATGMTVVIAYLLPLACRHAASPRLLLLLRSDAYHHVHRAYIPHDPLQLAGRGLTTGRHVRVLQSGASPTAAPDCWVQAVSHRFLAHLVSVSSRVHLFS